MRPPEAPPSSELSLLLDLDEALLPSLLPTQHHITSSQLQNNCSHIPGITACRSSTMPTSDGAVQMRRCTNLPHLGNGLCTAQLPHEGMQLSCPYNRTCIHERVWSDVCVPCLSSCIEKVLACLGSECRWGHTNSRRSAGQKRLQGPCPQLTDFLHQRLCPPSLQTAQSNRHLPLWSLPSHLQAYNSLISH